MRCLHVFITGFVFIFLLHISVFSQETQEFDTIETETTPTAYGFSVGIKVGTPGFGGEACFQLTPRIHFRLGGSYYKHTLNLHDFEDQIQGEAYGKVGGISFITNFHFGRPFFLSVGGFYNFLEANINGLLSESLNLNGVEIVPEEVGSLHVNLKPGFSVSPYAGLGFGRAISANKKLSFAFELGIIYLNSPDVLLHTTGMLTPTSSEEQQNQLNENLSWFTLYPVMNFQLSYRIF